MAPRPFNVVSKTRHGLMIHNAFDTDVGRSLSLYSEFAQHEVAFLQQWLKTNDVVIDVGANFGVHTLSFAHKVGYSGRVFSFEPQRLVCQALCGTIALNSLFNVFVYHAAAGESEKKLNIAVLNPWQPLNIGSFELTGEITQTTDYHEAVPVIPLDTLEIDHCHMIKIDAESMENIDRNPQANSVR